MRRLVLTDEHAICLDDVVIVNSAQVVATSGQVDRVGRAQGRARRNEMSHFEAVSSTVGDDQCHAVVIVSEKAPGDEREDILSLLGCRTHERSLLFAARFWGQWVATAKCGLKSVAASAGRVQRKVKMGERGWQSPRNGPFEQCPGVREVPR